MPDVMITGPDGRLEARYHLSPADDAPIVLVMHPHPRHGGTMNNKVVYTLYRSFAARGFSCMRFNFRGVGRSEGQYSGGEGELADAAAALDWLQATRPNAHRCWVAGFSFGSWITLQLLMRRPEISSFVAAAPPTNLYDFGFLAPCPAPGLIVQGNRDSIVPPEGSQELADRLRQQRGLDIQHHVVSGADHFFTGLQEELGDVVTDYLEASPDARGALPI